MDFGQLLANKTDIIVEQWIAAVCEDRRIKSSDLLSSTAIKNHIPVILHAMVSVLSQTQDNDIKSIINASWEHDKVRARQSFNPVEVVREYHQLRMVIFETIEASLLEETPKNIVRYWQLIDTVIDEAIAHCFHNYMNERLTEVQSLQSALQLHNQELTRLIDSHHEQVSQLAHDLKRPLTSIIGYSDLFLRQQKKQETNPANFEHIERVLRNGRFLLKIINNLLDISRCETGRVKLELVPINICELIENTCQVLQPLATAKNLPIFIDCTNAPQQVITDALKMRQIVTNLINNAIRYTESGIINIISQIRDNNTWEIIVSDTGIGITLEDQQGIFQPFYHPNRQKAQLPDSTGLGLALVSRLVKLLQGEIKVNSQVDLGSTFTVIFPLQMEIK
ncbi:MAG TPA: HAMP domain-containing sensor histidine kinase [Nostocaceae cyanobacterium]|nr:HAMP domain-containing sensor histidine kinase [Nostocaceae cyanobacterium]